MRAGPARIRPLIYTHPNRTTEVRRCPMARRFLRSTVVLAIFAIPAASQNPWTAPLTPDGQPDLQGNWLSKSATPLERPKELAGHPVLTDEEVAELKRRAARIFKNSESDFAAGDNLFFAALANPGRFKSPTATGDASDMIEREFDNRTSLIVDPPDGRIPRLHARRDRRGATADIAAALAQQFARRSAGSHSRSALHHVRRAEARRHLQLGQFRLLPDRANPGLSSCYSRKRSTNARIIPLDGRPHLPPTSVPGMAIRAAVGKAPRWSSIRPTFPPRLISWDRPKACT